jgi:hypothetical protein
MKEKTTVKVEKSLHTPDTLGFLPEDVKAKIKPEPKAEPKTSKADEIADAFLKAIRNPIQTFSTWLEKPNSEQKLKRVSFWAVVVVSAVALLVVAVIFILNNLDAIVLAIAIVFALSLTVTGIIGHFRNRPPVDTKPSEDAEAERRKRLLQTNRKIGRNFIMALLCQVYHLVGILPPETLEDVLTHDNYRIKDGFTHHRYKAMKADGGTIDAGKALKHLQDVAEEMLLSNEITGFSSNTTLIDEFDVPVFQVVDIDVSNATFVFIEVVVVTEKFARAKGLLRRDAPKPPDIDDDEFV